MSTYTSYHSVRRIEASSGSTALCIELRDESGTISDVTIHTGDRRLSRQLAEAINGVMAQREYLVRLPDAETDGANAA